MEDEKTEKFYENLMILLCLMTFVGLFVKLLI